MAELLKCPVGSEQRKRANDPVRYRLYSIKSKCKQKGIDFDIEESDIVVPSHCPLLGVPLVLYSDLGVQYSKDNIWSIDRKDPNRGYVKGNVWVISHRANIMKHNATLEELELLVTNLKKEIGRRDHDRSNKRVLAPPVAKRLNTGLRIRW